MIDDRKAILARRASFVAAAIASAGVGGATSACARPAVCLEPPPSRIEVIVPEADAGPADEPADGELPARSPGPQAPAPAPTEPSPRICLSEL